MAKKAITDAVAARLAVNWVTTPILKINEDMGTPADGSSWVRLQFPVSNDIQTVLGRSYRATGAFRIVVATVIAGGLPDSMNYCEQIATIFRNQKFEGVQCLTPTIGEGVDDGSYFIATVIVPFRYEYRD
ncbi:MAG: hypothetical protein FJX15_13135 [Alphaproteobacteria bacterium]|nr:hypothetical protein [Alphaproteobacteria bacterium]